MEWCVSIYEEWRAAGHNSLVRTAKMMTAVLVFCAALIWMSFSAAPAEMSRIPYSRGTDAADRDAGGLTVRKPVAEAVHTLAGSTAAVSAVGRLSVQEYGGLLFLIHAVFHDNDTILYGFSRFVNRFSPAFFPFAPAAVDKSGKPCYDGHSFGERRTENA